MFPSLMEAQPTLKELSIEVEVEERDIMESELAQHQWSTRERRKKNKQLNLKDVRALIHGDNGAA